MRTEEDDMPGLSREDRTFLKVMDAEMSRSSSGKLSAPLPCRENRPILPNTFEQAKNRAQKLAANLHRDPIKCEHLLEFMRNIFSNDYAEEVPAKDDGKEVWYLPIFGVYHRHKPTKIRVVFDSSSRFKGVCLNDILLKGPGLTNNLVRVLLNFRKDRFAAIADIEQMFFNFEVSEEHRDMLRFLWFKDNDPKMPLVEYRMKVHVFGNSPSPAVATYGLRKAVCDHDKGACDQVCQYVKDSFYVDDGLVSKPHEKDLVDLITQTQRRLYEGGKIRLHKIMSNGPEVLKGFSVNDLSKDIIHID